MKPVKEKSWPGGFVGVPSGIPVSNQAPEGSGFSWQDNIHFFSIISPFFQKVLQCFFIGLVSFLAEENEPYQSDIRVGLHKIHYGLQGDGGRFLQGVPIGAGADGGKGDAL